MWYFERNPKYQRLKTTHHNIFWTEFCPLFSRTILSLLSDSSEIGWRRTSRQEKIWKLHKTDRTDKRLHSIHCQGQKWDFGPYTGWFPGTFLGSVETLHPESSQNDDFSGLSRNYGWWLLRCTYPHTGSIQCILTQWVPWLYCPPVQKHLRDGHPYIHRSTRTNHHHLIQRIVDSLWNINDWQKSVFNT